MSKFTVLGNPITSSVALSMAHFRTPFDNANVPNVIVYHDAYMMCIATPTTMQISTFCEGDVSVVTCATREAYDAEYKRAEVFYKEER